MLNYPDSIVLSSLLFSVAWLGVTAIRTLRAQKIDNALIKTLEQANELHQKRSLNLIEQLEIVTKDYEDINKELEKLKGRKR